MLLPLNIITLNNMVSWKKVSSRENIGKFLLKLPNSIFPPYRCFVNITEQSQDFDNSNVSSSSNSSIFLHPRRNITKRRCKNCTKSQLDDSEEQIEDTTFVDDSILAGSLVPPPPPPFPFHLTPETYKTDIDNPERQLKISTDDLVKVKLRRASSFHRVDTPTAAPAPNDMVEVLRRRYLAMHTPTPKKVRNAFILDREEEEFDDLVD